MAKTKAKATPKLSRKAEPTPTREPVVFQRSPGYGVVSPDFYLGPADGVPCPPGGPPTELQPDVWLYKGVFSRALCAAVIKRFEGDDRKARRGNTDGPEAAYRRGEMLMISGDTRPEWKDLDTPIAAGIEQVVFHHFLSQRYPQAGMEQLEDSGYDVTVYRNAEDGCDVHADGGFDGRRAASLIVYLNDVKKGGETFFPKWNLSVRPQAGNVLVFSPHYTHFHGAHPTDEERYIILTWVCHKAPKMSHSHGGLPPHSH